MLWILTDSYPRFKGVAQSGLISSYRVEGEPDTKWSEQIRVLEYCFGFISAPFIFGLAKSMRVPDLASMLSMYYISVRRRIPPPSCSHRKQRVVEGQPVSLHSVLHREIKLWGLLCLSAAHEQIEHAVSVSHVIWLWMKISTWRYGFRQWNPQWWHSWESPHLPRDMPSGDAGSGIASTAMCATSAQAPTQRRSARQLRTQTDSRHRLGRAPSARENGCRATLTKAGVAAVLAAASSGQAIDVYQ